MFVRGFEAAAFGTNCWVVAPAEGEQCVVIDPGIGVQDQLDALLTQHRLQPVAVLLTHGHLDHTFSVTPVCGARGIPAIASDCEAYRDVIDHGVNGFLVKYDHEWLSYMSELARDDGLRAKMGEAARAMAARHTIEEHWTRWAGAYRGLF